MKNGNGKPFPDWKPKQLIEITTKKSSSVSANSLKDRSGNYKIYGATGYLKSVDFYNEEKEYIAIVKDGAGVGRLLLCEAKTSVLGTLDIISNNEGIDLKFLYYILSSIDFSKYTTGSTIPHIYYKDYALETIELPCFDEQLKISSILSSIDKKIEIEKGTLNQLAIQKRILLKDLFM